MRPPRAAAAAGTCPSMHIISALNSPISSTTATLDKINDPARFTVALAPLPSFRPDSYVIPSPPDGQAFKFNERLDCSEKCRWHNLR